MNAPQNRVFTPARIVVSRSDGTLYGVVRREDLGAIPSRG